MSGNRCATDECILDADTWSSLYQNCISTCSAPDKSCDPGDQPASAEPGPSPSTWQDRLYAALQDVRPPGKFATSATYTEKLPDTPLLTVEGVGPLTLPLSMMQAAALLVAGGMAVHTNLTGVPAGIYWT
jgi:hypothetical protein